MKSHFPATCRNFCASVVIVKHLETFWANGKQKQSTDRGVENFPSSILRIWSCLFTLTNTRTSKQKESLFDKNRDRSINHSARKVSNFSFSLFFRFLSFGNIFLYFQEKLIATKKIEFK